MTKFPHLAQRLFNTPLALHPAKGEIVMVALADRFGLAHLFKPSGEVLILPQMMDDRAFGGSNEPRQEVGYQVIRGIAIIEISGTLVHKLGTLQPYSGMTGYDGIRANVVMAMNDPKVEGIIFDIDSPGGEVSGCFDVVDMIYNARGTKPMWAMLTESAYSAAFAIATACDRVIVPRTGGTGSVGVIAMLVEFSKALTAAGINVTMITYGDHKADGNQYTPLEASVLKRFQADVNVMGKIFVDIVARNLGISAKDVQNTQAMTYLGSAGVDVGFAHAVMAPDQTFRAFRTELG